MNNSCSKYVWFMRHGKINFNYENCTYDEFIEILSNGSQKGLAQKHSINFAAFPKNIELICHSPAKRALETAEKINEHLNVSKIQQLDLLAEVNFDNNIISKKEYKSLEDSRPLILERWFDGTNKSESFEESILRIKKIEEFLQNRKERTIILVTHGWFLRLLELYFVKNKREGIMLHDLLSVKPITLGKYVKATFNPENSNNLNFCDASTLHANQNHFEFECSK